MMGFIIALIMVLVFGIAMVTDLYDLHTQVKASEKEYNELKKRV